MATLLVRKLEPVLVVRPRRRAPAHGRSVEAGHLAILQAALQPTLTGAELLELLREGRSGRREPIPVSGARTTAASRRISDPDGDRARR